MATHSKSASPATTIEVTARTFALPADCPCCGAVSDTEVAVPLARRARDRVAADSARAVDFPYCRFCLDHAGVWDAAGVLSAGLSVIGIGAGAAVAVASSPALGVSIAVAAIVVGLGLAAGRRAQARHGCRESCSSPQLAVDYLGWSGTASTFAFQSLSYAAKFAEQNSHKLVENPKVRTLLDRYKLARIAVPTPAAAVQAIPPPPDVAEWMARLTAMPGRVARRAALERALEVLTEPRERDQVMRAVVGVELARIMAPIERLSSGRERAIEAAIAQVRADNMPEELRAALLRDLAANK
jgi:hypothetical protein